MVVNRPRESWEQLALDPVVEPTHVGRKEGLDWSCKALAI